MPGQGTKSQIITDSSSCEDLEGLFGLFVFENEETKVSSGQRWELALCDFSASRITET